MGKRRAERRSLSMLGEIVFMSLHHTSTASARCSRPSCYSQRRNPDGGNRSTGHYYLAPGPPCRVASPLMDSLAVKAPHYGRVVLSNPSAEVHNPLAELGPVSHGSVSYSFLKEQLYDPGTSRISARHNPSCPRA